MDLRQWITAKGGPSQVARILNVEKSTVSQWYRFKSLPKDQIKLKIVKLSKGEVTLESMVKKFAVENNWK